MMRKKWMGQVVAILMSAIIIGNQGSVVRANEENFSVEKDEAVQNEIDENVQDEIENNTANSDIEVANEKIVEVEESNMEAQMEYICQTMGRSIEDIAMVENLRDVDGEDFFLLVTFSLGGYAILVKGYNYSVEYADTGVSPYIGIDQIKYYLGGLQYYYKENGKLKSIITGQEVSENDRRIALQVKEKLLQQLMSQKKAGRAQSRTVINSDEVVLPQKDAIETMYFGDNVDGTCGIIAGSMLLTYYDEFVNGSFLPKELELTRHYDDKLHQELLNNYRIHQTFGGSMPGDEELLINFYLGQEQGRQKMGYHVKSALLLSNGLIESIKQGNPGILYTGFTGDYSQHSMLAYGYKTENGNTKLKVHTGWHSRYNPNCENLAEVCDHSNSPWVDSGFLSIGGVLWLERYKAHTHNFSSKLAPTLEQPGISSRNLIGCIECNLITEDDHTNSTILATEIGYDVPITGKINYNGDEDWFKLEAPYKGGYTFQMKSKNEKNAYFYFYVYDENDKVVVSHVGPGEVNRYEVLEKGTYHIRVKTYYYGYDENYELVVKKGEKDDFGDSQKDAFAIGYEEKIKGKINYRDDEDWFKLEAPYKGGYTFQMKSKNEKNAYFYFYVYDENDKVVVSHVGPGEVNRYEVLEKGTYHIKVKTYYYGYDENYELVVKKGEKDDFGDSQKDAFAIGYEEKIKGKINYRDDEDWFKLEVPYRGGYTFQTKSTNEKNAYFYFYVYDENDKVVVSHVGPGEVNRYEVLEKGTYHIKVKTYYYGYDENYELVVNKNEKTISGIVKKDAHIIGYEETVKGKSNYKVDEDWFKIKSPHKGQYNFQVKSTNEKRLFLFLCLR